MKPSNSRLRWWLIGGTPWRGFQCTRPALPFRRRTRSRRCLLRGRRGGCGSPRSGRTGSGAAAAAGRRNFRTPSRADADLQKMRPLSASSGGLQKRKTQEATGHPRALATVRKAAIVRTVTPSQDEKHYETKASESSPQPLKIGQSHPCRRRPNAELSDPRTPDRDRDREADQGSRHEPMGPSRRHHDPGRLSPRPARERTGRSALGSDRLRPCTSACSPGQAGHPATHPILGDEMRALAQAAARAGPEITVRVHLGTRLAVLHQRLCQLVERAGEAAGLGFKAHPHMLRHACGFALANKGHDTRALQAYLGHKNIQHTVRYTEFSPTRFKDFWK